MNEGPDSFQFKSEEIIPKRVGILLTAIDDLFSQYDIDCPNDVELTGPNAYSVEIATEEDVARALHGHFKNLKQLTEPLGEVGEGLPMPVDRIADYVATHPLFIAFLDKARMIEREK